jgi:hypothetical protein
MRLGILTFACVLIAGTALAHPEAAFHRDTAPGFDLLQDKQLHRANLHRIRAMGDTDHVALRQHQEAAPQIEVKDSALCPHLRARLMEAYACGSYAPKSKSCVPDAMSRTMDINALMRGITNAAVCTGALGKAPG